MAEKENLIERSTRQSAGAILDANGNFSEGSAQKGGVNTAPPCPRPNVAPVAYNRVSASQNTNGQAAQNSGTESKA